MSVVKANIQTVEDMYRLIWTAIANKRPISAVYKELPRLFCPHRAGSQSPRPTSRALLPIWRRERERFGADRVSGELALRRVREVAPGQDGGGLLEDCPKPFPPSDLRGGRGY
jgi:hypothetical protein